MLLLEDAPTMREAVDGPAALDALLFIDGMMPGVNRRLLAEQARAMRPGLRVLYTTDYTPNAIMHNGVADAEVDLLTPYLRPTGADAAPGVG